MNRTTLIGLAGLVATLMCSACGRHVTIDPVVVPSRNAIDWTIQSVPAPTPPLSSAVPTAPAAGQPSPAAPPAP